MEFKDTKTWEAEAAQNPEEAERCLYEAFASDERYKGNYKWLEDRQRTLLKIYYEKGDEAGVVRIIEATRDYFSQEGRIKKFESTLERPYPGKRQEFEKRKPSKEPIEDSSSFKRALYESRLKEAEEWLNEIAPALDKYKKDPRILKERREELKEARRIWEESE